MTALLLVLLGALILPVYAQRPASSGANLSSVVRAWLPIERRSADEPDDDWKWTLRSTANRPLLR
jgi:hypothetical protein